MRALRYWLAIALTVIVTSCVRTNLSNLTDSKVSSGAQNAQLVTDPLRGYLAEKDFSDQLRVAVDNRSQGRAGNSGIKMSVDASAFSKSERMLVYGWSIPGYKNLSGFGIAGNLRALTININRFYEANGYIPQDGIEYALWKHSSANPMYVKPLRLKSDRELLELYGVFVNPATGRFYESFDSKTWRPNGVSIRQLSGHDELVRICGSEREASDLQDVHGLSAIWIISVFGRAKDEVIAERPVVLWKRTVAEQGELVNQRNMKQSGATAGSNGSCHCD